MTNDYPAGEQVSASPRSNCNFILLFVALVVLGCSAVYVAGTLGVVPAIIGIAACMALLRGVVDFTFMCRLLIVALPFVPTYIWENGPSFITGPRVIFVLLVTTFVSAFFAYVLRPARFRLPSFSAIFYLYVLVFVLGALNGARSTISTPDYFKAMSIVVSTSPIDYLISSLVIPLLIPLTCIACALLTTNAHKPDSASGPMFISALGFAAMIVWYALAQPLPFPELAGQASRGFLSGTGLHANEIGLLMNMVFALSLFSWSESTSIRQRIVLSVLVLTSATAATFSFSRAAFLGTFFVIVYLAWWKKSSVTLIGICAITLALVLSPIPLLQRSAEAIRYQDVSVLSSGRVEDIWIPMLSELKAHPIIGNGHGSILWSEAAHKQLILPVGHPHSAYLGALLDVGIIGSAVVAGFYMHMWRTFYQVSSTVRIDVLRGFFGGARACIILLAIQGVTDDSFMPTFTHCYLWLSYGFAIGLQARHRRAGNNESDDRSPPTQCLEK